MTTHRTGPAPDVAPADVLWRIESRPVTGGLVFEHELSFPSGKVSHAAFQSAGARLHTDDLAAAEKRIYSGLESALSRMDKKGEPLLGEGLAAAVRAVGADMTDRLIPENVRDFFRYHLGAIDSILLETDEPRIPWELARLGERGREDYICVLANVGRWISRNPTPPSPWLRLERLSGFVAADVDDFPALPAAASEAELLERLLIEESGMRGEVLQDARTSDFLEQLETAPDLLHFVGHGDTDAGDPDQASLVFADRSLPAHTLSGEILSAIAERRPVVALNACRTGRQGYALTGIGGWPDRWLRLGRCGALLCPQWAVRDSTATRFMEGFYGRLARDPRMTLGRAVQETRQELLDEGSEDPTPLAYALYGHPNARVVWGPRSEDEAGELEPAAAEPGGISVTAPWQDPSLSTVPEHRRDRSSNKLAGASIVRTILGLILGLVAFLALSQRTATRIDIEIGTRQLAFELAEDAAVVEGSLVFHDLTVERFARMELEARELRVLQAPGGATLLPSIEGPLSLTAREAASQWSIEALGENLGTVRDLRAAAGARIEIRSAVGRRPPGDPIGPPETFDLKIAMLPAAPIHVQFPESFQLYAEFVDLRVSGQRDFERGDGTLVLEGAAPPEGAPARPLATIFSGTKDLVLAASVPRTETARSLSGLDLPITEIEFLEQAPSGELQTTVFRNGILRYPEQPRLGPVEIRAGDLLGLDHLEEFQVRSLSIDSTEGDLRLRLHGRAGKIVSGAPGFSEDLRLRRYQKLFVAPAGVWLLVCLLGGPVSVALGNWLWSRWHAPTRG